MPKGVQVRVLSSVFRIGGLIKVLHKAGSLVRLGPYRLMSYRKIYENALAEVIDVRPYDYNRRYFCKVIIVEGVHKGYTHYEESDRMTLLTPLEHLIYRSGTDNELGT